MSQANELIQSDRTKLEITADLMTTKVILQELINAHKASAKRSRGRSLVITKLQEAQFWALEAQIEEN